MPEYWVAAAGRLASGFGSKGDAGSQETRLTCVAWLAGQVSEYAIRLFRHLIDCEEDKRGLGVVFNTYSSSRSEASNLSVIHQASHREAP